MAEDKDKDKAPAQTAAPQRIDTDLSTKKDNEAPEDPRQGLPDNVNLQIPSEGEKGFMPYQLNPTVSTDPNNQYIQYIGVGTVRVMGPAEWKAAGVDSEDFFEWNGLNKKRIARSVFTDEQLQYMLRVDDRFELVTVEPESEEDK